MSIERIIAAAPTPIPAVVGQSIPVTGIGLGVAEDLGVAEPLGLAVGVAVPQRQSVAEVQSGFLQEPPEQIFPEVQFEFVVHVSLQVPGAGDAVGLGEGVTVGLGDGDAVAAAAKLHADKFVVQAAPGAGQQYWVPPAPHV